MKKKVLLVLCALLLVSGCKDVKLSNGENAVVTFKEGGISSNDLYESLKSVYGAEKIIDLMDNYLLSSLYKDSAEETEYVNQTIKSIKQSAKSANIDFELYINYYYGVSNEKEFENYLALNYKRDLWKNDYAKETVTEKQINGYYDEKVYGDINASQILITIDANDEDSDEVKKDAEEKALKKANDIIKQLKDGKDFALLAKDNSEDESTASNGGSLGKINSDDVKSEVFDALLTMKDGTYSTTPVKASNGYYILYRTSQEKKPELTDDLKEEIKEKVADEIASDTGFSIKAQKALREKNEMKFVDTNLEKSYNNLLSRLEQQNSNN